jgi:RNA polymerase sigma-70 factor (ECF subfamily)
VTIRDDIVAEVPRLRRYARILLKDQGAADDLVQDCLERALSRLHLFQPGTNLRAWLFTIMHNLHVNAVIRARREAPAWNGDAASDGLHCAIPPSQGQGLALRDMERALDQLTSEQRAVVLLVGVEGLSYAETASVLNVPVGTVMSRLARGRERLRILMNGVDPDPPGTV